MYFTDEELEMMRDGLDWYLKEGPLTANENVVRALQTKIEDELTLRRYL